MKTISELVRIRSINPGYPGVNYEHELGGETDANKYLAEKYEQCGLTVDMWEEDKDRVNLVGVWKGTGGGRSLILNGHIDTVPPGLSENWKSGDPFSGKVADGRIYGRGSCDMKGPDVCQLMAVKALRQAGVRLKGDMILASTVGEENMDSARIEEEGGSQIDPGEKGCQGVQPDQ